MNLNGNGIEPASDQPASLPPNGVGPLTAFSDSDFFTTIRGRIGFAWNHWLLYGTGGGIGLNYETRIQQPFNEFSGEKTEFNWGYTVGGGVEYMLNCHWTLRAEYLYFRTETQRFSISSPLAPGIGPFAYEGHTFGNIIRAGLNYKF